jgi:diaminopropionate ammonia-lyase
MMHIFHNPGISNAANLRTEDVTALGCGAEAAPLAYLAHCPVHKATSMVDLSALAASLGIASLHIKDESTRLGLSSFKALGGAYAVIRAVHAEAAAQLGHEVPIEALMSEPVRHIAAGMTFACATDGNHGRSLATGARLMGAKSVIFVHEGVSSRRVDAIRDAGATIQTIAGSYDDAVGAAKLAAEKHHWRLISDTSWPGYDVVPRQVMQGYSVAAAEAWAQLDAPPTHIFLQAGVGGFAAAIAVHAATRWPDAPPKIIIVEPSRAACLMASAKAGQPVEVPHVESTIMGMLECFMPSLIAFDALYKLASAFVTVDDDDAATAMRQFAKPLGSDTAIISGESGAAGLAAVLGFARDAAACAALGLGRTSRVLVFNTEGATDPDIYNAIIGQGHADVTLGHNLSLAT